jgi:hypothetical protein
MNISRAGHTVHATYISILNNETKKEMELSAISKMEPIIKKEFPNDFFFLGEVCSFSFSIHGTNLYFKQMPLWLIGILYSLESDMNTVGIGYILNDDAISYLNDMQKIFRSFRPLMDENVPMPKLEFPLSKKRKSDFLKLLPPELLSLTVRCENPTKTLDGAFIECNVCVPCKRWIEVKHLENQNGLGQKIC